MTVEESIHNRFIRFQDALDERTRRLWAANEAIELGRGGIATVGTTGMALNTVKKGISELWDLKSTRQLLVL